MKEPGNSKPSGNKGHITIGPKTKKKTPLRGHHHSAQTD